MNEIHRVLCVVESTTPKQRALHRAVEIARIYGAELILHTSYTDMGNMAFFGHGHEVITNFNIEAHRKLERNLDEMAEPIRQEGITVKTNVQLHGSMCESVLDTAKLERADIVVKDTHYHSNAERAIFTNTDWSLIRTCPISLWFVKRDAPLHQEQTVLACVDPLSEHRGSEVMDKEIMETSMDLAARTGGKVHAFHAYNPLISIGDAATWALHPRRVAIDDIREQVRDTHTQAFEKLLAEWDLPPSHGHLGCGRISELLPAAISELEATVVVMGATTRGRYSRMIIGSTAERVMDHIQCDLVVVKPPKKDIARD